ncbi:hypothetical protein BMW23_1123 [Bodo saltans virus]|uniref:Uncharacterized protein n=1 Tax=Bodo saltans virus TaxID=2024608 RepID=A0A2H4UWB0_9VIRU|nr:hypothetical protein QJ851_gp1103 [Bodo saltans virus]ATZ81166.1 hypothetical protein BMW23_1123 [Bodo saltans virus]
MIPRRILHKKILSWATIKKYYPGQPLSRAYFKHSKLPLTVA